MVQHGSTHLRVDGPARQSGPLGVSMKSPCHAGRSGCRERCDRERPTCLLPPVSRAPLLRPKHFTGNGSLFRMPVFFYLPPVRPARKIKRDSSRLRVLPPFPWLGGHSMSRIVRRLLVVVLAVPMLAAAGQPKEKPAAPAEQYQALVKVHQDALQTYSEALGKAKTYEERLKVFDEVYPKPEKLAPTFLELAEKYPQDPVAFDALTWIVVNCVRSPARIPARAKAVAILSQDHARSEKLGPMFQNIASGYDEETPTLLTAILDKNPSKDVQAEACLALVQQYGRRLEIAKRL